MEVKDLARIRAEMASAISEETGDWEVKYAKLLGISDALLGGIKGPKPKGKFMARKLCAYYMRKNGFTFQQIADIIGVATHATAFKHYNDCVDFIEGGVLSDKDYLKAHGLAKEKGIW